MTTDPNSNEDQRITLRRKVVSYGMQLRASLEIEIVAEKIIEFIQEWWSGKEFSVLMYNDRFGDVECIAAVGARTEIAEHRRTYIGNHPSQKITLSSFSDIVQDRHSLREVYTRLGARQLPEEAELQIFLKDENMNIAVVDIWTFGDDTPPDTTSFTEFEQSYLSESAGAALRQADSIRTVRDLVVKDDVSGLYNSRFLDDALEHEYQRSQRYGAAFSVVFLDLDYFKHVNDNHGHRVGTEVLRETAQKIKHELRDSDLAIRYGGDEFVLILPETTKEDALVVSKRILYSLRETEFGEKFGLKLKITASLGVSNYPVDTSEKQAMIDISDKAMYLVKEEQRDGIATLEGMVDFI